MCLFYIKVCKVDPGEYCADREEELGFLSIKRRYKGSLRHQIENTSKKELHKFVFLCFHCSLQKSRVYSSALYCTGY